MDINDYFRIFDAGADRKGTDSVKWDALERVFGKPDLTPLWVADMDFLSPACVRDALVKRAQSGIYGYTCGEDKALNAACEWMKRRHGLSVTTDQAMLSPGVVDSLYYAVQAYTDKEDTVVIQPPVYGPFEHAVKDTGRKLRYNALINTGSSWLMNLDDLETAFKEGAAMLILCSPHNPVGRIWTKEELISVCQLCDRYGVRLVCDEIHGDFEMPGYHHTPILTVTDNAVSFISATKTFNLAGLRCSTMLFGKKTDKEMMEKYLKRIGAGEINLFALTAQQAAYMGGEEWLNALLLYLKDTSDSVDMIIRERIPGAVTYPQEGTYLKWLDLNCLHMAQKDMERMMVDKCGVALSTGTAFTPWGKGFMRINLASPRQWVTGAVRRIAETLADS